MADDDRIVFADRHAPALPAGEYQVLLSHTVTHGAAAATALKGQRSLPFVVAGPRFGLAPSEVAGQFPPPGAVGEFGNVLPHVLLRRASLPWERSAVLGQEGKTPWLALLVLAESELKSSALVPAASLVTAAVGAAAPALAPAAPFATLSREPGDQLGQSVQVIDIDAGLARLWLPSADELSLLAGVRELQDQGGLAKGEPRALVMANRLPRPGQRNLVHLVSLEQQYRGQPAQHWAQGPAPGAATRVRLVSLANWDFTCDADSVHFEGLLEQLTIGEFRLDAAGLGAAQGPVDAGAVPVEYRLGNGEHTAAWYHGPLATRLRAPVLPLPARHADELLFTEAATGLTDISYAAAWTLGRLLALRDPGVGVPLNQWKRQVAQAAHAAQWVDIAPAGKGPSAGPNQGSLLSPLLPAALHSWFDNALGRLAAVPFSYLVPEPALLPPETICLLRVEPAWLQALVDGAFSMGRHSRLQATQDAALGVVLPRMAERSAVLLRSALVAGWPDLLVDGFGAPTAALSAGPALAPLRFERLAKDTLLVLFEGRLNRVELHLHPQAMHFGFDVTPAGGFNKGSAVPVPMRPDTVQPPRGVVDIATLQSALKTNGPHAFAARLLEGVPRASFSLQEIWS